MYKVEIITAVCNFIIGTPEASSASEALDKVMYALSIDNVLPLEDGSLIQMMDTKQIIAIRAFDEPETQNIDTPEEPQVKSYNELIASGQPNVFTDNVDCLGMNLKVTIIAYSCHFLLYQINEKLALDVVGEKNYNKIIGTWLKLHQYANGYSVVIPHGALDTQEDAVEYLKDYVRETAPEHKPAEKTGQAFTAWNATKGV